MSMEIRPLSQGNALLVEGLSLWEPLSTEVVDALREAWSRTGLLVFRRQALSETEIVEFSARFGDLDVIVRTDWQSAGRPEVIHVSNMKDSTGRSFGGLGAGELGWHSDQSYMQRPATGSLLYMVEMPPEGGRTYWANLAKAYETLDPALKSAAQDKHGTFDYLKRQSTYDDEAPMSPELRRKTPVVAHPLVNHHPRTGVPSLYLDPTTTVGVHEMPGADGEALLAALNAHATKEDHVYAHEWQIGDVVMWDNGLVLHRRDPFAASSNRLLKRTTFRLDPAVHVVPCGFEVPVG
jgi:taurine dioxygenase